MRAISIFLLVLAMNVRADGPGHHFNTNPGIVFTGVFQSAALGIIPCSATDGIGTIVSHVVISGGKFLDLVSDNTWALSGSVPFNAAESLTFPGGAAAESIGPFSTADFYSIASGALGPGGAFNFGSTANFVVTIIFKVGTGAGTTEGFFGSSGPANGNGVSAIKTTAPSCQFDYGGSTFGTGNTPAGTYHVVSFAGDYPNLHARHKIDSAVSSGVLGIAAGFPPPSNQAITIGKWRQAFVGFSGKVVEICVRSMPVLATSAQLDTINNAVLNAK